MRVKAGIDVQDFYRYITDKIWDINNNKILTYTNWRVWQLNKFYQKTINDTLGVIRKYGDTIPISRRHISEIGMVSPYFPYFPRISPPVSANR